MLLDSKHVSQNLSINLNICIPAGSGVWGFGFLRVSYLKLEQGWMIQWPMAFCRTLSFIRAFLDPNNFMASLLSVGAKIFCSWFLTHPGLDSLETEFLGRKWCSNIPLKISELNLDVLTVPTSSFGVPYRDTSSFSVWKWTLLFGTFTASQ